MDLNSPIATILKPPASQAGVQMMLIMLVIAPVITILAGFIAPDYRKTAGQPLILEVLVWFGFVSGVRRRAAATPKKKGDPLRSRPFPCRDNLTPEGV
jgi:uncharacterized RDD family membrane protein YckC